jgi:integrase
MGENRTMPRLTNTIPRYRKHRASNQAIVELNGRRHYLGPHGTKASKLEYDRLVAEYLASGRSPAYGTPASEITVVELVAGYLAYAKAYYGDAKRGTYANLKRGVAPLKKLYGHTPAAEFGPPQFKAIRQGQIDENLSRPYVNEIMRRIVGVFRWGASEGLIPASIPQTLAMIPGLRKGRSGVREPKPVKPVDLEIVEQTLPHLSGVVEAMVRLQMLTGCRPGELCVLRPIDVDRSGKVWEAKLTEHKTAIHGQERIIYIGPKAQDVLRPFLLRGAEDYCFSPAEAMQEMRDRRSAARKTPLSCGNRAGTNVSRKPKRNPGDRYTTQAYGVAIARVCKKHGIPKWRPNQLRHALATRVRREFDLDSARTLLGHSKIGTTQVYAEQDRTKAIQVAAKIG